MRFWRNKVEREQARVFARSIQIFASDKDGKRGVLVIGTDAPWMALDVRDMNSMSGFEPRALHELGVYETAGGGSRFLVDEDNKISIAGFSIK